SQVFTTRAIRTQDSNWDTNCRKYSFVLRHWRNYVSSWLIVASKWIGGTQFFIRESGVCKCVCYKSLKLQSQLHSSCRSRGMQPPCRSVRNLLTWENCSGTTVLGIYC